jgi:hypothetical protein
VASGGFRVDSAKRRLVLTPLHLWRRINGQPDFVELAQELIKLIYKKQLFTVGGAHAKPFAEPAPSRVRQTRTLHPNTDDLVCADRPRSPPQERLEGVRGEDQAAIGDN